MNRQGVRNLHFIEGIIDKYMYCDILEREFLGTLHAQGLDEEVVIFFNTIMILNRSFIMFKNG
jgi:hypothetical protein